MVREYVAVEFAGVALATVFGQRVHELEAEPFPLPVTVDDDGNRTAVTYP